MAGKDVSTNPTTRKAQFRSEARAIMDERKGFGSGHDTTGAITRALERAYKAGIANAGRPEQPDEDVSDGINWNVIPRKTRDALQIAFIHMKKHMPSILRGEMNVIFIKRDLYPLPDKMAMCIIRRGDDIPPNQLLVSQSSGDWGPATITPLVKLGLAATLSNGSIALIESGVKTIERASQEGLMWS